MAGDLFEDGDRGTPRLDHGGARDDESLFEGILAFEHGVADAVGENHPTGIGWKFPALLGAGFAESCVFFHGVVTAMHEIVVGGAMGAEKMQGSGERAHPAGERICAAQAGEAYGFGEIGANGFEGLRSVPDTVLRGIDVGEEAEDAVAVRWASGKGVEVRKIITGMKTGGATELFERTETCEVKFPSSGVGSEELREKFFGALGIISKDEAKARGFLLLGFGEAGDAVFGGTIGDVFMECRAGLRAAEEKIAVGLRNGEG